MKYIKKFNIIKEGFDMPDTYLEVKDDEGKEFPFNDKGDLRRETGVNKIDIRLINRIHEKLGIPLRIIDYSKYNKENENFIKIHYQNSWEFPSFEIVMRKYSGDYYLIRLDIRYRRIDSEIETVSHLERNYICDDIEGLQDFINDISVEYPFIKKVQ